jgi:hypothetical protein
MNLFQRPHYQSDATLFINGLKQKNPELEASQLEGRARLWDKTIDADSQRQAQEAKVPQAAYVYQTK